MITVQDYQKLGVELRHMMTLLAFWSEPLAVKTIASYMKASCGLRNVERYVNESISFFIKHHWVDRSTKGGDKFVFTGDLSRAAYELMAREGDANHWWPSANVAGEAGVRDLFPELHRVATQIYARRPSLPMFVSEGLRLVVTGTGAGASNDFLKALDGDHGLALARAIANAGVRRFAEEPEFKFAKDDILLQILPQWFSYSFLLGRSVLRALAELRRLAADKPKWKNQLIESYLSLCTWTGHVDWTQEVEGSARNPVHVAIAYLNAGDLKKVDNEAREWTLDWGYERHQEENHDNLPVRALLAVATAFMKPEKVGKKRPSELLDGECSSGYGAHADLWAAQDYATHIRKIGEWSHVFWNDASDGRTNVLAYIRKRGSVGPITGLLGAVAYYRLQAGRRDWRDVAGMIWNYAKTADANGWPTLARLFSALLSGGYDNASEETYLHGLDSRGVEILPRKEPEPEWKGLLTALEKTLTKEMKAKAAQAPESAFAKSLVWYVSLAKVKGTSLYTIEHVRGAIHKKGDGEDLSEDEVLDSYGFDKKSVRSLMTEKDRLIFSAKYSPTHSYYGSPVTDELVKNLCGAPNLIDCKYVQDGWSEHWEQTGKPMVLEEQKCKMTSSVNEDGGLVLSIPNWTLALDQNWCIRRIEKERFFFVRVDASAQKVINIFRTFGTDGRVVIPREGMARAEPLIESLATLIPLAEPSADAKNLKRVTAANDVRLRLDFVDGVFTVRAVVLPMPENPNLTLDPGFGPGEKLIVGAVTSFILVRDLAAEALALAPVRTALKDCEDAFDGKSLWQFGDLAEGLGALVQLKTLEGQVPMEWLHSQKLSLTYAPASGVKLTSQRTADDWFRVDGQFELDDGRVLSVVELLEASKSRSGKYVRLSDGDYVALTDSMTRELDALNAAGRRKGSSVEIVKAAIPMLDNVFGRDDQSLKLPDAMEVTAEEIRAAFAKRPTPPNTLNAELRSYQVDGYRWLSRLAACGFGSCLADDMGLGKTIQVITLLLERAANGASLVIAPSSVCGNWRREINRFAPTLNPMVALEEGVDISKAGVRDIVIASYGYLLFHEEEFASVTWNGLVLDEAQAIKNDASKRAKMVKRLHAKFRVAATGTPVENRLGELWSLFDFLNPGLLGPAASFAQRFTVDGKAVPELKRLVKPLILRRLKGDVLDDLPEKTEVTIPVVLGKAEREAYEGCRLHALQQLASKGEEGGANRMSILAELTRLRRFCCHPSLVLPGVGVSSAKMEALVELLEGLHEGHHRALIFSQFTDYLAIVRKVLDAHGWSHLYLDGTTPTLERERLVNAFQGGEGEFFVISLKAGGTGLNLTAANYVILLDPWWNPAVENQAADRAHRIGQKNPVTVYRLIASDTVEARVIELHQEKMAIAEDVLEGTSSSSLTPAQLMKLFS